MGNNMTDYEKICDFHNLFQAHLAARRGKQKNREVIQFEINLSRNLVELSENLKKHTYQIAGYYSFKVFDPKERTIHALYYRDRVLQHCLCDQVLGSFLDKRLVYDNAACRKEKGTHFALKRTTEFLRKYYQKNGRDGYFLKCDIRKFFDNIDHNVLKRQLTAVIKDEDVLDLLFLIIDSYETSPGKGLPLGNQTSQWFALFYLNSLDRLVKEKFRVKFYSRYMDDCVLIHKDKSLLKDYLQEMKSLIEDELKLEFNQKTQIVPIKNGIDYLGFHFYLTKTGKVVRKVRQQTKYKYKRKLKLMEKRYAEGTMQMNEIRQVIMSYQAHLRHGHTFHLRKKVLKSFVLSRSGGGHQDGNDMVTFDEGEYI